MKEYSNSKRAKKARDRWSAFDFFLFSLIFIRYLGSIYVRKRLSFMFVMRRIECKTCDLTSHERKYVIAIMGWNNSTELIEFVPVRADPCSSTNGSSYARLLSLPATNVVRAGGKVREFSMSKRKPCGQGRHWARKCWCRVLENPLESRWPRGAVMTAVFSNTWRRPARTRRRMPEAEQQQCSLDLCDIYKVFLTDALVINLSDQAYSKSIVITLFLFPPRLSCWPLPNEARSEIFITGRRVHIFLLLNVSLYGSVFKTIVVYVRACSILSCPRASPKVHIKRHLYVLKLLLICILYIFLETISEYFFCKRTFYNIHPWLIQKRFF